MELVPNYELLVELTKREIKQRYKQSILGYGWVILNPLIQMATLSFVFSKVLNLNDLEVPYSIFLYVGLLPWTMLNSTLTASAQALSTNGKLLTKIYLPRTVFVQSVVLAKLVDFLLAATLLLAFMVYFRVPITLFSLWIIPFLIIQFIFTYGLSLLIAALNLFYRDVQYLLNFMLLIWMYLTPIIYPTSLFGDRYQWLFYINPMAMLVTAYRQILFEGKVPSGELIGLNLFLSLFCYTVGSFVFNKLQGKFADVV